MPLPLPYTYMLVDVAIAGWRHHAGYNCYALRGAVDVDDRGPDGTYETNISQCQQRCVRRFACTGFMVRLSRRQGHGLTCWLRSHVELSKCDADAKRFHIFLRSGALQLTTLPNKSTAGDPVASSTSTAEGRVARSWLQRARLGSCNDTSEHAFSRLEGSCLSGSQAGWGLNHREAANWEVAAYICTLYALICTYAVAQSPRGR